MELSGKIIQLLPEKSGESARGPWRKQEYILETEGQYPRQVCFMAWSDKIDEFAIEEGENLVFSVDLESYDSARWYADVKAWSVTRADSSADNTSSCAAESHNDMQNQEKSTLDEVIPFKFTSGSLIGFSRKSVHKNYKGY